MRCSRIHAAPTAMSRTTGRAGPAHHGGLSRSRLQRPASVLTARLRQSRPALHDFRHFSSNSNALHGPPGAEALASGAGRDGLVRKILGRRSASRSRIRAQWRPCLGRMSRCMSAIDRLVGRGWAPGPIVSRLPARPKRPIRRSKTGWRQAHLVRPRNDLATFLTILRCNFDVEARFADHGKLNTALRAPISATRPSDEDAAWPNPARGKNDDAENQVSQACSRCRAHRLRGLDGDGRVFVRRQRIRRQQAQGSRSRAGKAPDAASRRRRSRAEGAGAHRRRGDAAARAPMRARSAFPDRPRPTSARCWRPASSASSTSCRSSRASTSRRATWC